MKIKNEYRIKTFLFFCLSFIICLIYPSVTNAADLLKLTTTAQETDYVVKIGTTSYNITTINNLANTTFALLKWEAKGSADTKTITGTFNGTKYTGFDEVYAIVYELLLKSATKSFANGSNLSTDKALSGTNIWKITGTVTTQAGYITSPADSKLIVVGADGAILKFGSIETRINIGRADATDSGNVAFLGRNSDNKLTIRGMGTSYVPTYAPFVLKSGSLYFNNTTIKNFYFEGGETSTIYIPPEHDAARYLYMSNSSITSITGTHSPTIFCKAYYEEGSNTENAKSKLYLYNNVFSSCKIKNNNEAGDNITTTNGGACIRSFAADNSALRVENCTFENNKVGTGTAKKHVTGSGGGAIYWKSVANKASLINCTFTGNSTTSVGGAVYNTGSMEIVGCTFDGNTANYGGGAIAVEPPVTSSLYANIDVSNMKGSLTLDENTTILNNVAGKYGGGILFYALEGKIKNPVTSYEMELIIDGTTITTNSSSDSGGGIAMYLNYKEHDYKVGVTINSGSTVSGNTATNQGGAIWMSNAETCLCNLNNGVTMNGGLLEENTSEIGGAICITSNVESASMDFKMNGGTVKGNEATTNGGAVYLAGGDFIMTGGKLGEVQGTKKYGNKAMQGGAIYVTGGNFTMDGGTIEGNTATNSGGGIHISDGNVYITDGLISANVARGESLTKDSNVGYGGGIFVDGGETVSIIGGEISKNVAAKNGGGIEVKTDKVVTVDIDSGIFQNNVADECGGAIGVECNNGIINIGRLNCDGSDSSSHVHPVLTDNIAGVQGGGFYMSGLNAILNIYCGQVDNNKVGEVENNFDQSNGTVTLHEGVQIGNEGIIVIGGTFDDLRNSTTDKFDVIYYCNYNDSTEFKKASVSAGAMLTLPTDIFGIVDYDIVGWTEDSANTTIIDYNVGEVLEVTKNINLYALWVLEEENEPTYFVVIPTEIELKNSNTTTFDIETTLNLFPRNKTLNIIIDSDLIVKLLDNESEIETLTYTIENYGEKIEKGGIISSHSSDSALITYNSLETIKLTMNDIPTYAGEYVGNLTFNISVEDT